jgi:hypothetical protein
MSSEPLAGSIVYAFGKKETCSTTNSGVLSLVCQRDEFQTWIKDSAMLVLLPWVKGIC